MLAHLLVVLLILAGYLAFALVKPDKACRRCGGWCQKAKRRRNKACPRCKGTGRHFRLGAPLVHRGKSMAIRYARERMEGER